MSNAFHFGGDLAGTIAVVCGLLGARAGDDQEHLVPAVAIFCAQPVHRGAQATGPRAVKVGDLYYAHTLRTRVPRVQSTMPT